VEEKEDGKEEGDSEEGGGNSGIHKYFGKSNKSFKLVTNKIKKNFRLQDYQVPLSLYQERLPAVINQCVLTKVIFKRSLKDQAQMRIQMEQ
jgi:hypothetical protein